MPAVRRPLPAALLLFAIAVVVPIAVAGAVALIAPGTPELVTRLIAVLLMAAIALVVVLVIERRMLRLSWGATVLTVVIALVALAPFVTGFSAQPASTVAILLAGYVATGIYEELWFRGLILRALRSWTPMRAALLSAALFGLAHLANIAFGANPAITAAQVVGTFCFGVGYAAARLHGQSLWLLALLHALTDIGLAVTNIDGPWRWGLMIGGDTVLLVAGLIVLARRRQA
jgi:membrane protease YdiL (CAAX protease family)